MTGLRRLLTDRGRTGVRVRRALAGAVLVVVAAGSFAMGARYAPEDEDDGVPRGPAVQTVKKSMWGPTEHEGKALFPVYRDLGVGIKLNAIRWDWTAPRRPENPADPDDPAYEWPADLTRAIAKARKYRMEVQVMVLGTPRWANGGRDWRWMPERPADFGAFMTALSRRYPVVKDWMIWGEPNRAPNFQPFTPVEEGEETGPLDEDQQVAPRNYAELLDAAYEAIKGVDRKDKVIGGNTYPSAGTDDINPYQWIRYLKLPDGRRPRFDMYGHNPFGFAEPDLDDEPSRKGVVAFADLRRLAEELDANFEGRPKKLFLAEWGVPQGFKDKDLGYVRSPEEAEEWIEAGFEIAREWDRIYTLGWIHPVDTERNSTGLLRINNKKKPTYDAYKGS